MREKRMPRELMMRRKRTRGKLRKRESIRDEEEGKGND